MVVIRGLDSVSPLAHPPRMLVEPLLHRLDDVLVFPPRNPALLARGTAILERAALASMGRVAA